jgi:predicted negative regulator of RcsB-dependent stress response
MAKKKITRKELLKKDDEFISLSNRIYMYVSDHAKQIQYFVLSIVLILAIISGIGLYLKHLNKKALAAYNIAYKNMVADFFPEKESDAAKKSIEAIDNIIDQYGYTKIATLAIPQLAYLKFGQGKYDEAISLYESYLKKQKSDSLYNSMAHFGLAAAYEAKGEHAPAIKNLENIINDKDNFLREEAMFSMGRIYAHSGQLDASKKVFQDFVSQFPESSLLPLAKSYLK